MKINLNCNILKMIFFFSISSNVFLLFLSSEGRNSSRSRMSVCHSGKEGYDLYSRSLSPEDRRRRRSWSRLHEFFFYDTLSLLCFIITLFSSQLYRTILKCVVNIVYHRSNFIVHF